MQPALWPSSRKPARGGIPLALGRLPKGEMGKSEKAYADHLAALKAAGEILFFHFEAIKFRLADKTFYTPDFLVMTRELALELHEVKGFWADDARVTIKVAAATYPMFRFIAVKARAKKDGGGWSEEEF